MTTKEAIKAEVDRVGEEHLDELYEMITRFAQSKQPGGKPSLMSRLKRIQIDAPEDFAANADLYTNEGLRAE